jgi:hypothetical protein
MPPSQAVKQTVLQTTREFTIVGVVGNCLKIITNDITTEAKNDEET